MVRFLQVNLGRGREAEDLLLQAAVEKGAGVLIVSEQYRIPDTGFWFQDTTGRAAINVRGQDPKIKEVGKPTANYVWLGIGGVRIYSCYFSPSETYEVFRKQLDALENNLREARGEVVVASDFNCKSPEWGSRRLDRRSEALSEMITRLDLVLNEGNALTFRRGSTSSVVDITLGTIVAAAKMKAWRVLEDFTLSDHQYIEFELGTEQTRRTRQEPLSKVGVKKAGWALRRLDKNKLNLFLETARKQGNPPRMGDTKELDALVSYATEIITAACDAAMPRCKNYTRGRQPVHW
ncbi:uncharacterized protein LOC107270416 [Cephus cinctus]|uniref:Uncharacterized protein LOC107270416 n=1 Tax=Cephus cinctus TaxID=211228 RepID=A0AAJ7C3E2_CEPCN|nr:uncharacterized protein LOC107270416 [Cephus cinctus]